MAARNPVRRPLERLSDPEGGGVDYGALAGLLGEHLPIRLRCLLQTPSSLVFHSNLECAARCQELDHGQ